MKNRLFSVFLTALLCCLTLMPSMAEDAQNVLTAEPWVNTVGTNLTLNADGSAVLNSGMEIPGEWSFQDPDLVFSYELYGSRTMELKLEKKDDVWHLGNSEGADFVWKSVSDALLASGAAEAEGYLLPLGETVTLPFVTFTLERTELVDLVGGDQSYSPAPEGYKMFNLRGTVENLSGGELDLQNIFAQFTFNGEYIYHGAVQGYNTSGLFFTLDPKTRADLNIYALIPEEMADSITSATALFSFNDLMATRPNAITDGSFLFRVEIGEEEAAKTKEGPEFQKTYFEECPVLLKPDGFANVYQSGHQSSTVNGKTRSISYSYASRKKSDHPQDLLNRYIEKLKEDGMTVQAGGKETAILWGKKKVATVITSGNGIRIEIVPGNENLSRDASAASAASEAGEEKTYKLKQKIKANSAEITLNNTGMEREIYSNKTGKGTYHYYECSDGEIFYTVSGSFKNTGKQPVDIRNICAAVIINGEDQYRADVIGVGKKAKDFIMDVSPKKSTDCVVYAEIPREVLDGAGQIQVRLGFTDDFRTKVTTTGSLPIFDYCDQTFLIVTK